MSTTNKYFRYINKNSAIQKRSIKFNNISDLLSNFFKNLFSDNKFNIRIENYIIECFYHDVVVNTFNFYYDNGFILFDQKNFFMISSIFPEYAIFDNMYLSKLSTDNTQTQSSALDIPFSSFGSFKKFNPLPIKDCTTLTIPTTAITPTSTVTPITPVTPVTPVTPITPITHVTPVGTSNSFSRKDRHQNLKNKFKLLEESNKSNNLINTKVKKEKKNKSFDEDFEAKKEKERNERVVSRNKSTKFRVFESDKKSYNQMKKDIEKGLLKKNSIHPFFVIKFDVFEIMEKRNAIKFDNDDNINKEYELFDQLYSLYDENSDKESGTNCKNSTGGTNGTEDTKSNNSNIINVFVPHNYHYLSNEDKIKHAKKYKLTKEEFEEKYINMTNQKSNDKNNDNDMDNDTDSEGSDDDDYSDNDTDDHDDNDDNDDNDNNNKSNNVIQNKNDDNDDKNTKSKIDKEFMELIKNF